MKEYKHSTCIHSGVCDSKCLGCNDYSSILELADETDDELIENNRRKFREEWFDYLDNFYD